MNENDNLESYFCASYGILSIFVRQKQKLMQ